MDGRDIAPRHSEDQEASGSIAARRNYGAPHSDCHLAVINKTGLDSLYKIKLDYSVEPGFSRDADLLRAVERQLGLRLERAKGPVNRFVFENIQKPTEN